MVEVVLSIINLIVIVSLLFKIIQNNREIQKTYSLLMSLKSDINDIYIFHKDSFGKMEQVLVLQTKAISKILQNNEKKISKEDLSEFFNGKLS